jgi:hypothetical protein
MVTPVWQAFTVAGRDFEPIMAAYDGNINSVDMQSHAQVL